MKTLRNITLIAALFFAGSTFAQETSTSGADPIKEEAMQQTNDLDAIVGLSEEQRSKVFEVYVAVQRHEEALLERYANDPQGLEADKEYIDKSVRAQTSNEFVKILDAEQYDKYKLSLK